MKGLICHTKEAVLNFGERREGLKDFKQMYDREFAF